MLILSHRLTIADVTEQETKIFSSIICNKVFQLSVIPLAYPNHSFLTVLVLPNKLVLGVMTGKEFKDAARKRSQALLKERK